MARTKTPKIAVILYTLRDFAATPADAARTLRRVRKIGYEAIQVSGGPYLAIDPVEMRLIADGEGLAIVGAHVGFASMQEDFAGALARLRAYGCRYVAIPHWKTQTNDLPAWRAFGKLADKLGARFAKEGIQLQYHNHAHEFEKLGIRGGRGGQTAHAALLGAARPANLQAELDLAWASRAGYDPAALLADLPGRVDQVHAKDWGIVNGEPGWREVGEGGMNWPAIVKAARKAGVQTYIVEQDTCPVTNDPFRSIAISFENLAAMGL